VAALFDLRFYLTAASKLRKFLYDQIEDYYSRSQTHSIELAVSPDARARLRLREDIFVSSYEHLHIAESTLINSGVQIVFPANSSPNDGTSIFLGENTYVGRRVEFGVLEGNCISIGDYSSIQDNCVILGDVRIERYCTLSLNIFISSGNHYFTLFPSWLTKDQDAWVHSNASYSKKHSQPVHIEEDCWLGWGVFVKQGVYIGRGAVIGAYTVVTRDVPPYSVQVGAPNHEITRRLAFEPPVELQALNQDHWPYFMRAS
jgi:acetyltransferase-like isoleucine patch superfamily enzyme